MPVVSAFPKPKCNGRLRIIPQLQTTRCLIEKTVSFVIHFHLVSVFTTNLYLMLDSTMTVKNDDNAEKNINVC